MASRKGTLLIVDDEEGPRLSLEVIFKDDYEILLASDGPTMFWATEIDLKVHPNARIYVLPCIAGHVGADTAGVILSESPHESDEMTLIEMAKLVVDITESRSEIVFEALPIDDPQVRQPDITRAKQVLGWQPEIELEEGLRRMIAALGREPVGV